MDTLYFFQIYKFYKTLPILEKVIINYVITFNKRPCSLLESLKSKIKVVLLQ